MCRLFCRVAGESSLVRVIVFEKMEEKYVSKS